jgi:hypothetical protein
LSVRRGASFVRLLAAFTILMTPALAPSAADDFRRLTGSQVRAAIAGMEFTDEVHWVELYGTGGTVTSLAMGKKTVGKWRVDGDELCVEFEDSADCFEVSQAGARLRLKRSGTDGSPIEGVLRKPTSGRGR